MWSIFLWLSGCGFADECCQDHREHIEHASKPLATAPIKEDVWDYWQGRHGLSREALSEDRIYWSGEAAEVTAACGYLSCGCTNGKVIVHYVECDLCQTIAHELGHIASLIRHSHFDYPHQAWGNYYGEMTFALCRGD